MAGIFYLNFVYENRKCDKNTNLLKEWQGIALKKLFKKPRNKKLLPAGIS